MATFFEGEAIVNVVNLAAEGDSAAGTKYTCPAGHYAKVDILYLNDNASNGLIVRYFSNLTRELYVGNDADKITGLGPHFMMGSQDTIEASGLSFKSYAFLIREYAEPA